jgi:hypothetical protein
MSKIGRVLVTCYKNDCSPGSGNTAAKLVFVKASGSRVERKKPNLFAPAQRMCGARRFFIFVADTVDSRRRMQKKRRWMSMKRSKKVVNMDREALYDCLSTLLTNQKVNSKNVSVRCHSNATVITCESGASVSMNDTQSSEHEWKLDTSAVSEVRELVTICVACSSEKNARDLQRIVSAYEGTMRANGTQEFIVTATTSVKKVDGLIDQLMPFGIKCMSRTSLELDHHEHRFL